jgi:hypothetical protein
MVISLFLSALKYSAALCPCLAYPKIAIFIKY